MIGKQIPNFRFSVEDTKLLYTCSTIMRPILRG